MNGWKRIFPAIVFAIAGVTSLILAWAGPVIDGAPPPNYTSIKFAIIFLSLAVVMYFAIGRKSGGGSGSTNA